nr:hypothetical protein [Micromonospora sp. DSM 115978]
HPVEVRRALVPRLVDARHPEHAVGQRRLAVVDVRDDAEIADRRLVGNLRHGRNCAHAVISKISDAAGLASRRLRRLRRGHVFIVPGTAANRPSAPFLAASTGCRSPLAQR